LRRLVKKKRNRDYNNNNNRQLYLGVCLPLSNRFQQNMAGKRIRRKGGLGTGHMLVPKANTSSSMRIKAAAVKQIQTHYVPPRQQDRWDAKTKRLDSCKSISPCNPHIPSHSDLVFYAGSKVMAQKDNHFYVPTCLRVVWAGDKPVHCYDKVKSSLIFRRIPQSVLMEKLSNNLKTIINNIDGLCRQAKHNPRGDHKHPQFEKFHKKQQDKYTTVSISANRGGRGLRGTGPCTTNEWRYLKTKLKRHIEDIFNEWMEPELLKGLTLAKEAVEHERKVAEGYNTENHRKDEIFLGMACGLNAYLNSHIDDDFTYSVVVNLPTSPNKETKKACKYFCFPSQGLAVTLRPYDVLIFNAREKHCVSSLTKCYVKAQRDIFCVSFYLKSNVIGGNDNSVPCTPRQEQLAAAYDKYCSTIP